MTNNPKNQIKMAKKTAKKAPTKVFLISKDYTPEDGNCYLYRNARSKVAVTGYSNRFSARRGAKNANKKFIANGGVLVFKNA